MGFPLVQKGQDVHGHTCTHVWSCWGVSLQGGSNSKGMGQGEQDRGGDTDPHIPCLVREKRLTSGA